jgi:hypothetical protein
MGVRMMPSRPEPSGGIVFLAANHSVALIVSMQKACWT